jgi:tRNA threonylcarbamoyladenosine biosynthesis protein TsaB
MMSATSRLRLLWIDTAGPWCCVAIVDDTEVIVQRALDIRRGHGECLLGEVDAALRDARMTLDDVSAIGVCTGPGGYAGLRAGIAAAQGMASGARKPLIGVPRSEAVRGGEPVHPRWAASEASKLLRAGVTGGKPIYPAPPDAMVSTHQPADLID